MAAVVSCAAILLNAEATKKIDVGAVVLGPGAPGSFDDVAVKDPSIVRHEGKWHVFYTARDRAEYTLGYVSAHELSQLSHAKRRQLIQLHADKGKYAAAPQVFYFRPHRKWYLVFQTNDSNYQPVYSTSENINNPASWPPPKPLAPKNEPAKWIDFWVICDERQGYLFFTRDHKEVVVMTTRLEDFPLGFDKPRVVFSPVHEAVHVYRTQGRHPGYAMVYEKQQGDIRHFGLAQATAPDGKWEVTQERFAARELLKPSAGRWTDEVSHGELLRAGFDETLEAPTGKWDLLIQGLRKPQHRGQYPLLPWSLGLITVPDF